MCAPGPSRLGVVVALRWAVESIMIVTLHVLTPEQLGTKFHAAMGLGLGVALAVVAGRDGALLLQQPLGVLPRVLVRLVMLVNTVHAAGFMMLEMFTLASSAHSDLPIITAASLAMQACGAGCIWAGRQAAPLRARGPGGQNR